MGLIDSIKSLFSNNSNGSATSASTSGTNLADSQKRLEDALTNSQNKHTTAEAETARLNTVSQEAYKQTKLENEQAQNQFAQNMSANQLTALDAIRRSNASAIANGANAGLSAANQLSSILGLQQESTEAATDLANTSIDAAAKLNTQLNENAVTGAQTANEINAALGANEAELAKAIASNSDAIAGIEAARLAAEAQKEAAKTQAEATKVASGMSETTTTTTNKDGTTTTTTTPTKTTEQQKLEAEQREANYNRAISSLSNVTSGWNDDGKDNHTYATEYWDPFANGGKGELKKPGDESFRKSKADEMAKKIQAELNKAYNSGNADEIKKWTDHATKFATSMQSDTDACLTPNTLITLADKTYKKVKDVTNKDKLLVWDIVEGGFKEASVLFVEHDKKEKRNIITLKFDNKSHLEIIDDHGLFNTTLMKYVYIKTLEDAKQYIGHSFFYTDSCGCIKQTILKKASLRRRKTTAHSPCTAKHLCVIANNLLTMPGNTQPFTNVCKVNPDTFCYDKKDFFNCRNTYGLFSEKDFEGVLPPSIFFAFQGPLLKIKIAKGETSMEEINKLIERYSEYLI